MIAIDTNILVYAHREESPFHLQSQRILIQLAESNRSWAIPWPCIHEFLNITTHARLFKNPTSFENAWAFIQKCLESPNLILITETEIHAETLYRLIYDGKIAGPKIHDARIAAICIENGVSEFYTLDRDFNRFPALKTKNPLIS